jgi:hypothetical protein
MWRFRLGKSQQFAGFRELSLANRGQYRSKTSDRAVMIRRLRVILPAIFLTVASDYPAKAADPFPDFTFRRVKPPAADAKKRITIQITQPESPTEPEVLFAPTPETVPADWFWQQISAEISAAAPGRFQRALDILSQDPRSDGLAAPRFAELHALAATYGTDILISTLGTRLSPALILAVIAVETADQGRNQTDEHRLGLMGLTDAVLKSQSLTPPLTARAAIRAGVTHLEMLLTRFDNDPILALAAYRAGADAISQASGVPTDHPARAYVPAVIHAFQSARALCLTPPELYSDGCVFAMKETP